MRRGIAVVGAVLLALGLVLDLLYHLVPEAMAAQMATLVGPGGERAHLLTAAGFGLLLFAVLSATLLAEAEPR